MSQNTPHPPIDEALLHATVKWNTRLFAAICGFIGALTLLLITYLSLFRGQADPGDYLNLLGVFLPGYSVSTSGAWIGFLWGGVIGAVAGAITYRVYSLSIRQQVADYFAGEKSDEDLNYVVAKIYGHPLGLALGFLAAIGLLITTNWLVVRGTASESVHAELLSHYLIGYSVSVSGSIIGAIGVFVIIYLLCILLATIYNRIVALRQTGTKS